jgi:DNA-binding Xre family transcriptional regulator
MIRWSLATLLAKKGWSAYKLAHQAGITIPVAYKLADPDHTPSRIDVETLNKICTALRVQPGVFLKWEGT